MYFADRKDHRNGIKKPKRSRFMSMKGVDAKFLKNLRFAKVRKISNSFFQDFFLEIILSDFLELDKISKIKRKWYQMFSFWQ